MINDINKWKCGYCDRCGQISGLKEGFCVICGCRYDKAFRKRKPEGLFMTRKNCPIHGEIKTEKRSIECPLCLHIISGLSKRKNGELFEIYESKTGFIYDFSSGFLIIPERF